MSQAAQTIDSIVLDSNALASMTDAQLEAMLGQTDEAAVGDKEGDPTPQITKDEVPAEGVLARDGKNIIPFAVLDATRNNLSKAEAQAVAADAARVEAEAKYAELEAQLAAMKAGSTVAMNQEDALSEEDLAELEAEMPVLGKKLRDQQAQIAALSEQLDSQAESNQIIKAESVANAVQIAIDATPKLAFLQTQNTEAYEAAKRIDRVLRDDPNFKDLPLNDRFEEVIKRYEEVYGAVKLESKESIDLKKATAAALAAATSDKGAPKSMSDIPGGTPQVVDEAADVENKSGVELEQMFSKMSSIQIEAYLNRL